MVQRKGSEYAGLSVAIITPLRDNVLDVPRLREQVEYQIAAGTTCIVPVGTTGESPTLSHEEHERVISEVVQIAAGRVKVMAGTGSNSTAEALHLTRAKQHDAKIIQACRPYRRVEPPHTFQISNARIITFDRNGRMAQASMSFSNRDVNGVGERAIRESARTKIRYRRLGISQHRFGVAAERV